jgi:hypothetical protein
MSIPQNQFGRFKAGNGNWLSKSLFVEYNPIDPVYTLQDLDYKGYPSLRRLYLLSSDPTEYVFATEHLGGIDHLKYLLRQSWFEKEIQSWREELELKLRSEALTRLLLLSSDDTGKHYYEVNKFLIKGEYKDKDEAKRGRPSKEALRKKAQENLELLQDLERINGQNSDTTITQH